MKIDDLLGKYVQLRDKKAEIEKAHKAKVGQLTDVMKKIEAILLEHFNDTGSDSVKTSNGTAYKSIKTSVSVADRDIFLDFIRNNEAWAFLESRANKPAVEEYLEAHQELPPGINVSRVATVNIRRS